MPENSASSLGAAGAVIAFFRRYSLFAYAAVFAFLGQFLAAGTMILLDKENIVDFSAADPNETAAFNILAGAFILQIIFLLIGLARSGVIMRRILIGVASLIWAISSLMLLFVGLQCGLYDACL